MERRSIWAKFFSSSCYFYLLFSLIHIAQAVTWLYYISVISSVTFVDMLRIIYYYHYYYYYYTTTMAGRFFCMTRRRAMGTRGECGEGTGDTRQAGGIDMKAYETTRWRDELPWGMGWFWAVLDRRGGGGGPAGNREEYLLKLKAIGDKISLRDSGSLFFLLLCFGGLLQVAFVFCV